MENLNNFRNMNKILYGYCVYSTYMNGFLFEVTKYSNMQVDLQSLSQKIKEKQTHHGASKEVRLGVFVEGFQGKKKQENTWVVCTS